MEKPLNIEESLNEYKKTSKEKEDNKPEIPCRQLRIITTKGEDHDYTFTGHFKIERLTDSVLVKTFTNKEHKEIIGKYIINFDFIVSLEYKY